MNKFKLRFFLLVKLPMAYIAGLRLVSLDNNTCEVAVKHRWINQNPFKSMYFAVQVMAAELSTALLLIKYIKKSKANISTLVTSQESTYSKKATGKIYFKCSDYQIIKEGIDEALKNPDGAKLQLKSNAINSEGILVSSFSFEWSIRLRVKE